MFCRIAFVALVISAVAVSANMFALDHHVAKQVAAAHEKALAAGAASAGATATITLEGGWIGQIFDSVSALISLFGNGIAVPAETTSSYSFQSAELQNFVIGNINVFFQNPIALVIQLADIVYTAPATAFTITSGSTTCSGTFTVSVSNSFVNLALGLNVNDNGQLNVTGLTGSGTFNTVQITPSFSSACSLSTAAFESAAAAEVEGAITSGLPSKLGSLILPLIAKELSKLNVVFIGEPMITPGGRLALTVQILPGTQQQPKMLSKAVLASVPDRDVAISLDSASVDALLAALVAEKKLQFNTTIPANKVNTTVMKAIDPRAYTKCPQCPFNIEFYATEGPTTSFENGAVSLSINNAVVGVNAINPANLSDTSVDELLDFYINATIVLSNIYINHYDSKLYFMLAIPQFSLGLKHTSLGPINTENLTTFLGGVITKYVVPIFNMDFEGITVNLKPSSKLTLSNVTFAADSDVFTVATDLSVTIL